MSNIKFTVTSAFIGMLTALVISCNPSAKVEERNKAMLNEAHMELLTNGNLAYADGAFTSDYAGKGPQWIKDFVSARRAAFPDFQFKLEPVIAEGNMTAWLRTNTGTHRGDYNGVRATGKKVTWKEMVFTRYTADGKIAEEWSVGDAFEVLSKASGIEGVYEYLPPNQGQAINRNGKYIFLFGPADAKFPMNSNAGTYELMGDSIKNTIHYHTDPSQVGNVFYWKVKSWSGDTVEVVTMNEKGERTGGAKAVRVSY